MTHCQLIPNMPVLSDYGFGVCFNYLMLAAPEHGIQSLVIQNGTDFWALTERVEAPVANNQDPSWGIMCEMQEKELEKILKNRGRIAFHLKLLSPGGAREHIASVVDTKNDKRTFETLNAFFDWLPIKNGPDEIAADDISRWVRDLFRVDGMGFFVADPVSRTGLAFHHDMVDLVNLDGKNIWQSNFYGQCDLRTKIKQDDYEVKEYLNLVCASLDED